MPIRASERARYPKHWRKISESIRARAGQRCECRGECGIEHEQPCWDGWYPSEKKRCGARNGDFMPTGGRVVLTVAHLDHTPENCDHANLRAMCQRCHNRYDRPKRSAGIRARRCERLACGDLLEQCEGLEAVDAR